MTKNLKKKFLKVKVALYTVVTLDLLAFLMIVGIVGATETNPDLPATYGLGCIVLCVVFLVITGYLTKILLDVHDEYKRRFRKRKAGN